MTRDGNGIAVSVLLTEEEYAKLMYVSTFKDMPVGMLVKKWVCEASDDLDEAFSGGESGAKGGVKTANGGFGEAWRKSYLLKKYKL